MKSLVIAELVTVLLIFALTVPVFFVFRGNELEIPFGLMVVTLGITGILSAQLAFIRKRKEKQSRLLSIAVLVQILLLAILDIYVFITIDKGYYWYPITLLVLMLVLLVLVSTKIGLDKKAGGGKLI